MKKFSPFNIICWHLVVLIDYAFAKGGRGGGGLGGSGSGSRIRIPYFFGGSGGGATSGSESEEGIPAILLIIFVLIAVGVFIKSCYSCSKYMNNNEEERKYVKGRDAESLRQEKVVNIYRSLTARNHQTETQPYSYHI